MSSNEKTQLLYHLNSLRCTGAGSLDYVTKALRGIYIYSNGADYIHGFAFFNKEIKESETVPVAYMWPLWNCFVTLKYMHESQLPGFSHYRFSADYIHESRNFHDISIDLEKRNWENLRTQGKHIFTSDLKNQEAEPPLPFGGWVFFRNDGTNTTYDIPVWMIDSIKNFEYSRSVVMLLFQQLLVNKILYATREINIAMNDTLSRLEVNAVCWTKEGAEKQKMYLDEAAKRYADILPGVSQIETRSLEYTGEMEIIAAENARKLPEGSIILQLFKIEEGDVDWENPY